LIEQLIEVLCDGARAILTQAIEAEVLLAAPADLKSEDGCRPHGAGTSPSAVDVE
jgi:hypothetical protein